MSETNYERYFGTPERAAVSLEWGKWADVFNRWYYKNDKEGYAWAHLSEWLESEAE